MRSSHNRTKDEENPQPMYFHGLRVLLFLTERLERRLFLNPKFRNQENFYFISALPLERRNYHAAVLFLDKLSASIGSERFDELLNRFIIFVAFLYYEDIRVSLCSQ